MNKVAIVMATYNPNDEFFQKQITSIKNQTYSNWFCLIQDDCSSEDNYQLIIKIIGKDKRFEVARNISNQGPHRTFEAGLQRVGVEFAFVAFSDQDDVWLPNKLQTLVQEIQSNANIKLVHSDLMLIDEKDNLLNESCWKAERRIISFYTSELLVLRNSITGCSMLFDRSLLEVALPFPNQTITGSYYHDQWISLFAAKLGKIKAIKNPLTLYRQHGNNVVGSNSKYLKVFHENLFNPTTLLKKISEKIFNDLRSRLALLRQFYGTIQDN